MDDFLATVEKFLARHRDSGLTGTALGKLALGDPAFVSDLRRGRSPRLVTAQKVAACMLAADKAAARKASMLLREWVAEQDRRSARQAKQSRVAGSSPRGAAV